MFYIFRCKMSETNIYFFTLQRFGPSPSLNLFQKYNFMEVLEIKFTVFLIIEVSAWIFRNTILVLYLLENTRILSNQIPMVYILISGVIQPDTHGLRPHIWSYPARCPWFTSWYLELSSQISKAYILISGVIQPDTHGLHPDIRSYPARYLRLTSWYLELFSQISVVIQSDI